ncbi:hypothetical protein B0T13DRAFT_521619 [Neurospora crassa]|nr:hypothetical protein B0T13DRAFT_521619 [Neurospora crassa]
MSIPASLAVSKMRFPETEDTQLWPFARYKRVGIKSARALLNHDPENRTLEQYYIDPIRTDAGHESYPQQLNPAELRNYKRRIKWAAVQSLFKEATRRQVKRTQVADEQERIKRITTPWYLSPEISTALVAYIKPHPAPLSALRSTHKAAQKIVWGAYMFETTYGHFNLPRNRFNQPSLVDGSEEFASADLG